ncbi:hypothetical protein [Pseudobacteriovorax antillogorgiicola]|uniref:Uncharacterized protein n=1 Tax=Pseudobacteriovorax antillogorgiicola TaxID=1513793 RepID=A0A1Y6CWE2_9BACT|nr:hypothetical protein [Pseudobacteriovorax antillogorgiicola]TCS42841.1 hypothetical protein EDD56_1397 [Pseudobacteriovorax antillogorgiicola]SMF81802.1 hypothetical protein SAMN06296036_1386 [Pseudobacteriovorax antillogorgiicola]
MDFDSSDFERKQQVRKAKARELRRKAYQKAKEQQKAYREKQKHQGLTAEQQAEKEALKEKARELRRKAYQDAKAKHKASQKQKKLAEQEAREKARQARDSALSLEKLKLVTFDEDQGTFTPLKTPPPALRLIKTPGDSTD